MPLPSEILENAFRRALDNLHQPLVTDANNLADAELISRSQQNRAAIRLVLSCALAKIHRPEIDIRKPYTEIGGPDSFSGRTYDEQHLWPFLSRHQLPVNETTAFLTPALRNRNSTLTPGLNLVGRPAAVYTAALNLLDSAHRGNISADDLLAELMRWLVIVREEKRQLLELLLKGLQGATGEGLPLSTEEIVTLVRQHLNSPNSSRLPVLVVSAAYEAGEALLGERSMPLKSHNAADLQTGSIGDLEVALIGEDSVVTGYEMKTRRVTRSDIDIAIQKAIRQAGVQNYIFITTEPIEREVHEYAASLYAQTGGVEVAVLDCVSFLRHFLHLFHRRRAAYVEAYQRLVLEQPESAVGQPLKETWLALRQAAEIRTEPEGDAE